MNDIIDKLWEKYSTKCYLDKQGWNFNNEVTRMNDNGFRQAMHELINQMIEIVLPFILPNHTGDVREIIKDKLSYDILTKLEEQGNGCETNE